MNLKKGFTLIELLVVVAIVSLLSSIIFASLNSARAKTRDAAIKAQLSSLRSAAELMFSETGSYDTLCTAGTNSAQIFAGAADLNNRATNEAVCSSSGGTIMYRNASGNLVSGGKPATTGRWGASVRLVNSTNYYCVDYTGAAKEQASIGVYFTAEGTSDLEC